MKTIFENDRICVTTTGHDFDFIAIVENKTDKSVLINFEDIDTEIVIEANNYIGLLADEEGRGLLKQFKAGNFAIYNE